MRNRQKKSLKKFNNNTNYTRGVASEYQLIHKLKDARYVVIRAAGSHGPYDIVAINDEEILLIQVKTSRTKSSSKTQVASGMKTIDSVKPSKGTGTLKFHKFLAEKNIVKRKGN